MNDFLGVSMILVAQISSPQPVAELLRDVAQTYRNLTSYVVQAENITHETGEVGIGRTYTTIAFQDGVHFAFRARGIGKWDIVADGVWVRYYRPELGEFLEEPVNAKQKDHTQGVDVFARANGRLVYRFRQVDRYVEQARNLGTKTIGRGFLIERVEIRADEQDGDRWVDELWIDSSTKLVRRVLRKGTAPPGASSRLSETKFQYSYINSPIPARYFDLKIPANARRKDRFTVDRRAHSDQLPIP